MSRAALLRGRVVNLARRMRAWLQFFPLTVLCFFVNAARKTRVRRSEVVSVGHAGDARAMVVWLGHLMHAQPSGSIDICLDISREAVSPGVPDAFSAALAFPRVRSVGIYWDSEAFHDDLPLFASERLPRWPDGQPLDRVQVSDFAVSLAAARDAQTLLKRFAGPASVVCVNARVELSTPTQVSARFFHLDAGLGFTLHERMALVQAADAYVGERDELGHTALLCGRPALFVDSHVPTASEINDFLVRSFGAASLRPACSSTS